MSSASSYDWQPKQECETNDGRQCRIIAITPDGKLVWQVQLAGGDWAVHAWALENVGQFPHHPKPPLLTVDQWHRFDGQCVMFTYDQSIATARIRWTIGTDGKPEYAVRLDDEGEPMYAVVKR